MASLARALAVEACSLPRERTGEVFLPSFMGLDEYSGGPWSISSSTTVVELQHLLACVAKLNQACISKRGLLTGDALSSYASVKLSALCDQARADSGTEASWPTPPNRGIAAEAPRRGVTD